MDGGTNTKQATIYRMATEKHLCPYGLQAKDLLECEGFAVHDHWLTTRGQTDAFKREHQMKSTPQVIFGSIGA